MASCKARTIDASNVSEAMQNTFAPDETGNLDQDPASEVLAGRPRHSTNGAGWQLHRNKPRARFVQRCYVSGRRQSAAAVERTASL